MLYGDRALQRLWEGEYWMGVKVDCVLDLPVCPHHNLIVQVMIGLHSLRLYLGGL